MHVCITQVKKNSIMTVSTVCNVLPVYVTMYITDLSKVQKVLESELHLQEEKITKLIQEG